ncbi:MAG: galactokinase [Chitinophagaceae bacterium]
MNQPLVDQITSVFKEKFCKEPVLYFSPGRINIIGEHVDYNDGFVMPAAIDKGVYYAIALNGTTSQLNFFSVDFDEALSIDLEDVRPMDNWKNYVLSVINQFAVAGVEMAGFDCVLGGDIPRGSGMSSSAAVEGGMAFALNEMFNDNRYNRQELALLNQRAEHDYPKVNCGIMDQFANMNGMKDAVLLLDCRSIEHQYFPLKMDGYSLLLINTKVSHSLASSAYNERRKQCETGLQLMASDSAVRSFRDVAKAEDLLEYRGRMGEEVYTRCLFVVEEIARTQKAAVLLQANDIQGLGKLMYQAHEGLSKLYNVSCKELDFLVEQARKNPDVIGSRLMGGGFGGCTINIVANEALEVFVEDTLAAYLTEMGNYGEAYIVQTDDGTRKI